LRRRSRGTIITGDIPLSADAVRRVKRKGSKAAGHPVPASQAISELMTALGIDQTLRKFSVLTAWSDMVGEQIARVTVPDRIESGVLYVRVTTAPWRAELSMKRLEILQKINRAVGADVVKDIRFR
jgi:predicted nucleic acid-binding Zn ribbon protein